MSNLPTSMVGQVDGEVRLARLERARPSRPTDPGRTAVVAQAMRQESKALGFARRVLNDSRAIKK